MHENLKWGKKFAPEMHLPQIVADAAEKSQKKFSAQICGSISASTGKDDMTFSADFN